MRSRFITVDETGSQIQVENQGTYPVEIRGEMRMGKRMREKSRYDSLIETPKKEQERDEQECRELHLIRRVPNICSMVKNKWKGRIQTMVIHRHGSNPCKATFARSYVGDRRPEGPIGTGTDCRTDHGN